MKVFRTALASGIIILLSSALLAKDSVNVSGNLKADGYLTISINWTVDTARYGKLPPDAVKRAVYDDIWQETVPQLIAKSGAISSCERTKFTKIAEHRKLLKTRPDGSKIYDYDATIRFECQGNVNMIPEKEPSLQVQTFSSGFHDGFTNEADAF